jgi:uronate dehydrogenase
MSRSGVLVTGAAGRIGSILVPELARDYDVLAIDKRRGASTRRLSVNSLRRLARSLHGMRAVVHLAADARLGAPWKSAVRTNIRGTWTLLEAARLAGVRRIVYASSNAVTAGYERDEPWASVVTGRYTGVDSVDFPRISTTFPVRPTGAYAVSKIFGEAACRYYADYFGISAICIRIGSVYTDNRPHELRDFATWLSNDDLIRLVKASIEAPHNFPYAVFYGVSANTLRIYDTDDIEQLIGARPLDNAETWRGRL